MDYDAGNCTIVIGVFLNAVERLCLLATQFIRGSVLPCIPSREVSGIHAN